MHRFVARWAQPWQAGHQAGPVCRPLRANGIPYQGVNVLMLWMAAEIGGYTSPIWMTYQQASQLGGNVRKGEHGSRVPTENRLLRATRREPSSTHQFRPSTAAALAPPANQSVAPRHRGRNDRH